MEQPDASRIISGHSPAEAAPSGPPPDSSGPTVPGPIILFDGVCNLCHCSVQFILPRDKKGIFRFASLQSPAGQALLIKYRLPAGQTDSFVLVDKGSVYTRSSAALRVVKKLRGLWPLFSVFWIVPRPFRDRVYDYVARHRYQWFGKEEACWLPSPQWKKRFLD